MQRAYSLDLSESCRIASSHCEVADPTIVLSSSSGSNEKHLSRQGCASSILERLQEHRDQFKEVCPDSGQSGRRGPFEPQAKLPRVTIPKMRDNRYRSRLPPQTPPQPQTPGS